MIDSLPQVSKQAVFIKRLHDMQVLKHLSSCAKSADALRLQIFQHPEYKNCEYLGKICLAVCKDCEKCTSNREKAQKKEWEAQQALAKVNGKLNPLPPRGYALSDSIVDPSITPSWCRVCQLGERLDIEDGTNLLHCDACNRGTHDACEVLAEYLDADSSSFFLCTVCQRYPQKGLRPVDPRKPRAAPTRQRRAVQISPAKEMSRRPSRWDEDSPLHNVPSSYERQIQKGHSLLERYGKESNGRCEQAATDAHTTLTSLSESTRADGNMTIDPRGAVIPASDVSRTNIKILPYVVWNEKKSVLAKQNKPSTHVEMGSGAVQWVWFKKTNLPLRDAARAMGSSLGPLAANAISAEMQRALAGSMVNEPEVQPEKDMSSEEIDAWLTKDHLFTWFAHLKDETLITVLDRIYGVKSHEPFMRLRIANEIQKVKEGEVYYPVSEFTDHADNWLNMLLQLQQNGWVTTNVDLREVFLASIHTCTLVHDEAKSSRLQNVHRLIAELKKWVVRKDNEIQSAKAARISVMGATKPASTKDDEKSSHKELTAGERKVLALFTQQLASGGTKKDEDDKPTFDCNICGNKYPEGGKYPARCKKACVYGEHKDANKTGKYPKGKAPLTWKNYGEPYPPGAQAYFAAQDSRKANRGIAKKSTQ